MAEEHATAVDGGGEGARERHKLAERERRKGMRELFLNLHALLPHPATVRKEQSAILDEIIKYIPLAQARLRSLHARRRSSSSSSSSAAVEVSGPRCSAGSGADCDIRVAPESSSSVSVRIRGDRVTVSLSDAKGSSAAHGILLSAILEQLEVYNLDVVCTTHCRDGSKLLHHSESKIVGDHRSGSPALSKTKLQDLARNLHQLRKSPTLSSSVSSSNLKRSFDHI